MPAKIIVIDGLDGSGKATQSKEVTKRLCDMGYKAKRLTFPNYESPSSSLVKMYLSGELGDDPMAVNAYAASSFYAVDRIASFYRDWKEDFENFDYLICDRYTTSNIIHQMAKLDENQREEYIKWLFDFEYEKLGIPAPFIVCFLDLDPDVSQKLMLKRYEGDENKKDIHEKNVIYLISCRESAKYCIDHLSWIKIDCTDHEKHDIKDIRVITEMIMEQIQKNKG